MYKKHFAPWRKNLAVMMASLFVAAYLLAGLLKGHSFVSAAPAIPFLILALWSYKTYSKRVHGKRVERIAQKDLKKAARRAGWNVRFNVPCPSGGDIDATATIPTGRKFAIEIKSWLGLRVHRGVLVKLNGRRPDKDPIAQSIRQANSIGFVPVLWMPAANTRHAFMFRGVLVVTGQSKQLIKVLSKM